MKPLSVRLGAVALAIVLAASVWSACDNTRGETPPAAPSIDPTVEPAPAYGTFTGDVVVRSVDDRRVVVTVDDEPNGAPDGLADRVFSFQVEGQLESPVGIEANGATVRYMHGNLYLDRPGGDAGLHLRVGGYDIDEDTPLIPVQAASVRSGIDVTQSRREIVGVGLSHQLMADQDPFEMSRARDASEYASVSATSCADSQPFAEGDGVQARERNCSDGNCPAGGPGSTGCGANGCNVSCGNGYYAC